MLASRGWTDIRRPAVFYHCHHWIGILCPLISDVDYMPNGLRHVKYPLRVLGLR
jgi:hypothetical protein